MNEQIRQKFCLELGTEQVLFDEPMKKHTTFRIGGPADVFVMPRTIEEVSKALEICRQEQLPYFILGNGSNLLVSDQGYRGVIIQLDRNMEEITVDGTAIRAAAGALLSSIAVAARRASLAGFEFAGGIPGTLGGAVVMNAGAYGGEIKDCILGAMTLTKDGKTEYLTKEELELGYRSSRIQKEERIVLWALFAFAKGDTQKIEETMRDLNQRRREKQPLQYGSAGSTFKRPEGYFAGKLIEDAGLKGYRVGDVMVSDKHCGFVVNVGEGTYDEARQVIEHVQKTVEEKFHVSLELEVKMIQ